MGGMWRAVAVAVAVTGCVPSVKHYPLGPGTYSIDARGTTRTSSGELLRLMHVRAGQLCPYGYQVVDGSAGSKPVLINTTAGPILRSKPEGGLIVQCNAPPPTC